MADEKDSSLDLSSQDLEGEEEKRDHAATARASAGPIISNDAADQSCFSEADRIRMTFMSLNSEMALK